MEHHILISLSLSLLLLRCTSTLAQAPGPDPAGPTNVTKVLEKAGQFTTLIRLFRITQISDQINAQLNNSNGGGLTVFAPTDAAFSALPAGTLNSLSDEQKVALVHFHILTSFVSVPQFQTVSNPLRTQAGDGSPLNVTTDGNQVNVTTGVDGATVGNAVYSDGQLAVYQVDRVLLPLSLFGTAAPAAAPAASEGGRKRATADSPASGVDAVAVSSGAVGGGVGGVWGVGLAALAAVFL